MDKISLFLISIQVCALFSSSFHFIFKISEIALSSQVNSTQLPHYNWLIFISISSPNWKQLPPVDSRKPKQTRQRMTEIQEHVRFPGLEGTASFLVVQRIQLVQLGIVVRSDKLKTKPSRISLVQI